MMSRLVWKFWLAIWVAVVIMVGASFLTIFQWQRFESYSQAQNHPHALLQQLADRIEVALQHNSDIGALLETNEMSEFGTLYLINPQGADYLNRPLPSAILNSEPELSPPTTIKERAPVFARAIKVDESQTHFMIFQFSASANPMWLLFRRIGLGWVLAASLIIAGLISALLALSIVRPLNKLALASAQQETGSRSLDLDESLLRRRDEIGRLARQLKASAEQTGETIQRQQEFIRDVSHEVRSPLARLQVASETVLLDPSDTQALELIEREVSTIDQLVDDLLQLSKADAGVRPAVGLVDLNELLLACRRNLATALTAKHVEVMQTTSMSAMAVPGDARLLERALDNVLSNAVRYAPHHSTISVRASIVEDNCRISIQDCGPGVPQDKIQTIFEPFVRVDKSRHRCTGGFGIGLALVKKIIELHGGRVRARNSTASGLAVDIYLPVERATCAV